MLEIFDHLMAHLPTLALLGVICFLVAKLCRQSTSVNGLRRPKCIPHLPIVGSLPFMKIPEGQLQTYLMEQSSRFGNVFAFYSGSSYAVVLNGVDAIKEALVKRGTDFADRWQFYHQRNYTNINRSGIINGTYDASYRRRRKFYLSTMKQFGFGSNLMETRIHVEVEEMIKQVRLFSGRPFDPKDVITRCVLNVITSIVLGQRYVYDDPKLTEVRDIVRRRILAHVPELEVCSLLRFVPSIRQRLNGVISAQRGLNELADSKIKTYEEAGENDCIIQRCLEKSRKNEALEDGYDREEFIQLVSELFTAGADTSSTSLVWMISFLADHMDVQNRLRDELESVVPLSSGRLPCHSDAPHLPFTEAFILEAMRFKTLVPLSLLHATLCDTEVDGCFIPANSMVIVNLYSAHMDPTKWSKPHEFVPQRFLDESGKVTGKENVMSFSLGKRSCFGELMARQELFLFVTAMVQNFYIYPPEGQQTVGCHECSGLFIEPTQFHVRFVARN